MTGADVARFLGFLPDDARSELALGPIGGPDDEACRACQVLERFPRSGPAKALLHWHDISLLTLAELAGSRELEDLSDALPEDGPALELLKRMAGQLAYARCLTIYALAGYRGTPA
ncbi:MAG TPA: hypothetical protein VK506_14245 [Conexibacter sp.]|nr:hypothetical protein [Conexibacter sp.]